MQYGYRPSLGVSLFYVCADVVAHGSIQGGFVYRSLMMVLTTVLAGYLREQAQQAEAALEERLGQSTALNDATAVLGASLDLESVLRAAVAAAAQLFGSPMAVLQPSGDLGGLGAALVEPITFPDHETSPTRHALEQLCAREAASAGSLSRGDALIRVEALPGGREAIVLVLALAPRQAVLGTLAVVVPAGTSVTFDSDILDAFLERLTLAVENAALYRALAERSDDLQRAYSDLASAHQELLSVDQMKTNFLANVSHELRTPLTSIRSFSELLLGDDESPAVRKEFLHIINTESERLTRLVDDVLDISRIEAGHMIWHMQSVDLGRLLRESGRAFSAAAERQHLRLELDLAGDLPNLWGDRDRLYQVVANLLNNAIKFTHPGGTVGLAAEHDAAQGEVRIRVADTGVGIAPADQRRIFDKFQQVGDTLTEKPKGTGLGLAISRDIVEHHGGRVWVESYPGVGSTFTVALPVPSRVAVEQAA
jgi:signal transduction histidine kinase